MKYFFFLFSTFFLATCTPDDDLTPRPDETPLEALNRLVPITQNGAGTFGCLVNGELWIPEVDGASDVAADALGSLTSSYLSIDARKEPLSDSRNQLLSIGTTYNIGQRTSMFMGGTFFNDRLNSGECRFIDLDTSQINFFEISTHNSTGHVLSGTFECVFMESDCPEKKYKISHGRFDLKYRF